MSDSVLVRTALLLGAPLAFTTGALGQATVVPNEIQQPGTQPTEVSLESASRCDNCHGGYDPEVEPSHLWSGSAMAHAGRDPLFWATVAIAEQDFAGAGDLCLRCHSPDGWTGGRSTPTDGSALTAADADGVACDLCHQLTNPDGSEHAGVAERALRGQRRRRPGRGLLRQRHVRPVGRRNGEARSADTDSGVAPTPRHRRPSIARPRLLRDVPRRLQPRGRRPGARPRRDGSRSSTGHVQRGARRRPWTRRRPSTTSRSQYGVVERTFSEYKSRAPSSTLARSRTTATLPANLQAGAIERAPDDAVTMASTATGDYADSTTALRSRASPATCRRRPQARRATRTTPHVRSGRPRRTT